MKDKRCNKWFDEIILIIFTIGLIYVAYTKHKHIKINESNNVFIREVYMDNIKNNYIETSPTIYEYYEIPKSNLMETFKMSKNR